jgi:hypothetical protein
MDLPTALYIAVSPGVASAKVNELAERLIGVIRKFHFFDPGSPRRVRVKEVVEGAPMKADEGWTARGRHGKTAAPLTCQHPNSVRPDAGTTLRGLECLQTDLCRPLGRVSTRPSTLPGIVLRWLGGQDAQLWQPGADGLPQNAGRACSFSSRRAVYKLALKSQSVGKLKHPSTHSVLILWVEAFEPNACLLGGTWPVHPGLFGIACVLPRLRVWSSRVDLSEATSETLLRQAPQFHRSEIPPAPVLGRGVYLQALGEPARVLGCKGRIE